jgi:hypothetical protein
MPFQKGHSYGGAKPGAGRKPKKELEIKQAAAEIAKGFIEKNIKPVLDNYLRLANGWLETRYSENGTEYDTFVYDGPTTRHFVDKVLPNVEKQAPLGTVINVNFVQFQNNQHPAQLQAKDVSAAVLAIDGNGHQASGQGVASQERQGQNGLKFHDFQDVPGE